METAQQVNETQVAKRAAIVEAGKTDGKTLTFYAKQEAELVEKGQIADMSSRCGIWIKVAKAFKSAEDLKSYPGIFKAEMARRHGYLLNDGTVVKLKTLDKTDPEQRKRIEMYPSLVGVPASVCKAVFTSFQVNYDRTLAKLEGKGTINQKVKELPSKEAKPKAPSPAGSGKGKAKKIELILADGVTVDGMIKLCTTVPFEWIEKITHALGIRASQHVDTQGLSQLLMGALGAWDKQQEAKQGKQESTEEIEQQEAA